MPPLAPLAPLGGPVELIDFAPLASLTCRSSPPSLLPHPEGWGKAGCGASELGQVGHVGHDKWGKWGKCEGSGASGVSGAMSFSTQGPRWQKTLSGPLLRPLQHLVKP